VVDVALAGHAAVVHGLDAVAVRVEEERAVIVTRVLRTQACLTVALVAGFDAALPERIDLGARARPEADVQTARRCVTVRDREVTPLGELRAAVAELAGRSRLLESDRAQHGLVEALRRLTVADADRDVVDHSERSTDCAAL
jgi:hypothetical protein